MVVLQRRGVVFTTVLLRNTRTYLVGLRPTNFLFTPLSVLLPLVYFYVLQRDHISYHIISYHILNFFTF